MNARQKDRLIFAYFVGTLIALFALFLFAVVGVRGGPIQADAVDPSFEVLSNEKDQAGSGTLIQVGQEKLLLTAYHVAVSSYTAKSLRPSVSFKDGIRITWASGGVWEPMFLLQTTPTSRRLIKATFVYGTPPPIEGGKDLALLRPEQDDVAGIPVAKLDLRTKLVVGEDAWYCGCPADSEGDRLHRSLERTIINKIDYEANTGGRYTVVNGNGWYGISGGGLYVKRGNDHVLVGVTVRGMLSSRSNPKTPVGAVRGEDIADFLADYLKTLPVRQLPRCP